MKLFNYRPEGQTITTNSGDEKLIAIRRGPRGIVSVIDRRRVIVLWGPDDADAHIGDSENDLIQKTIDTIFKI
jgi:hypothetical protein